VRETFRKILNILGSLVAGIAILGVLLAWQLSRGPISLGFLKPVIEQSLLPGEHIKNLKVDDAILTWAGWERALDIRIINLRFLGLSGAEIMRIPELSLSLSASALAVGEIAPRSIEIFGPELRLVRTPSGTIEFGIRSTSSIVGVDAYTIVSWLFQPPVSGKQLDFLSTISVVGGELSVEDRRLKKIWNSPVEYAELTRTGTEVSLSAQLQLDLGGEVSDISLSGRLERYQKKMFAHIGFSRLPLAEVSEYFDKLGYLNNIDLLGDGFVSVESDLNGIINSSKFEINGGEGSITLPNLPEQKLLVENAYLKGKVFRAQDSVSIERLKVRFDPSSLLKLPQPIHHNIPIREVDVRGNYYPSQRKFEILESEVDFSGPIGGFTGTVNLLSLGHGKSDILVKGDGYLNQIDTREIKKLWPRFVKPDVRDWVTEHITAGFLDQLRSEFAFKFTHQNIVQVMKIKGDMVLNDLAVTYLSDIPPIAIENSYITFNNKKMVIHVDDARSENLTLTDGQMVITGLDKKDQAAGLSFKVHAPLSDALVYLDHPRLNFVSELELDAASSTGFIESQLELSFPLEKTLRLDNINFNVISEITNVSMSEVFSEYNLSKGKFQLSIDSKGMVVSGGAQLREIPLDLKWEINFLKDAPFRNRYNLRGHLKDVKQLEYFGVDSGLLDEKFIHGSLGIKLQHTSLDTLDHRLEVELDLKNTELIIPMLDLSKSNGVNSVFKFSSIISDDPIAKVSYFELVSEKIKFFGSAEYDRNTRKVKRVNVDRLAFDRTDIYGALITHRNNGWELGFQGSTFDFSSLWDEFIGDTDSNINEVLPTLTIAIEFKELWLNSETSLENVSGTFRHENGYWKTILFKGDLVTGGEIKIALRPNSSGRRNLDLESDDAGLVLQYLDYFEGMKGGRLWLTGQYDDTKPGRPLTGELFVRDYRITNAPMLARILSIMALTGILDAMQGEGLGFSKLQVPFVSHAGLLEIKDARASGASLGFTARGTIYTHADIVEIDGTVVPAYMINSAIKSALDYIPLLGNILTGEEKGGGVFAANFRMTGPQESPTVKINPLSALTPGILRNIFGIWDDENKKVNNKEKNKDLMKTKPYK